MSIKIFSKKAFSIGPGVSRDGATNESFVTVPGAFQDMPDGYEKDPTFILAVKDGDIVINNVTQVPVGGVVHDFEDEADTASTEPDPTEAFYEELKGKNKAEVKELAEKYGAEFVETDKLGQNKKRVFEAYKLSLNEKGE